MWAGAGIPAGYDRCGLGVVYQRVMTGVGWGWHTKGIIAGISLTICRDSDRNI